MAVQNATCTERFRTGHAVNTHSLKARTLEKTHFRLDDNITSKFEIDVERIMTDDGQVNLTTTRVTGDKIPKFG